MVWHREATAEKYTLLYHRAHSSINDHGRAVAHVPALMRTSGLSEGMAANAHAMGSCRFLLRLINAWPEKRALQERTED
jgi:hypothetical protein